MKEAIVSFHHRGQYHARWSNLDEMPSSTAEDVIETALEHGLEVSDDLEVDHIELWTMNMEPVS